jgi:hypothetical protein
MNILTGVAVLLLLAVLLFMYYRQNREKFVSVAKFREVIPDGKGMVFPQEMAQTYVFSDPIPDTATSFDRILSRFIDKHAPVSVAKTTFPEPAPYTDSEIEDIALKVLERVKGPDAPRLDFISTEYAAKGIDTQKNIHYDITFLVSDRVKNYALKLALVCLVDRDDNIWVKKFSSFNGFVKDDGPPGVTSIDEFVPVEFKPDFASYAEIYK